VQTPEVSVVIPVLNGERSLPALLQAIAAQAGPSHEVLVVDNGSSDATPTVARDHGAKVVSEPVRGRARARNAGVANAAAPLIAFTDADCVPEPGWLQGLVNGLQSSPLAAGRVRLLTGAPPNRWERLEGLWRFTQERNVAHGWAATANLGVRRAAFVEIGGFDATYRHIGEDVDFCLRAGRAGLTLGYRDDAVVSHGAERNARTIFRRAIVHGYSSQQHAQRWPGVVGWRHWRHPRPVIAGDWALRRFGEDAVVENDLLWPARLEYGGRVIGSAWAAVKRVR
jgi:GT2 family glycosyltransferase